MKVDELTPRTGRVNMPVKVLSLDEPRSMDNGTMICEGLVGHLRLSLGKTGSMKPSESTLESIKEQVNLSDLEYEMPRTGFRDRRGGGGKGRGPPSRWSVLMKLKRDTGNKKYFNRDEMSNEDIEKAIKEMGGE